MPRKQQRPQQGIQSIEVGGRLLKVLGSAREPMMLRDLATMARMPAAQAHRYLVSFIRMGLIEQDLATARYELGPFAVELGQSAVARLRPVTLAVPVLPELVQVTGQSIAISIWTRQGPTVVRWSGSEAPSSASLKPGFVIPLTQSATGRVFLAYLPEKVTNRQLRKELTDNRRHGVNPTTMATVERAVAQTRRQSRATIIDLVPGLSTMAVPVFDNGRIALTLIALGYTTPFKQAEDRIAMALTTRATALSKQLSAQA